MQFLGKLNRVKYQSFAMKLKIQKNNTKIIILKNTDNQNKSINLIKGLSQCHSNHKNSIIKLASNNNNNNSTSLRANKENLARLMRIINNQKKKLKENKKSNIL